MIISDKHKFVFISTPKTGSHSMFKLLEDDFGGLRVQDGEFHERIIPNEARDYFVFSTCRNPYSRAVALWNSFLHADDGKIGSAYRNTWLPIIGDDTFPSFCKYLRENSHKFETQKEGRYPKILTPQYLWYKGMNVPSDRVTALKMENLSNDFNKLKFVKNKVDIPHILKRKHKTFVELVADHGTQIVEDINEWASGDFERFGYDRF